jgi:hypothetical protein
MAILCSFKDFSPRNTRRHGADRPRIVAQWYRDGRGRPACRWRVDEGIESEPPA